MYYVYVLRSETTGKYYIGSTNNPDRHLKEHNGNQTTSLKNKGPFVIIYKETFTTLRLVRKRESEIKSYKSGNAFRKLIEGYK
ncbi:MAG: GIY-YIG nuclease family protein [Patescibacteria group bacterium]